MQKIWAVPLILGLAACAPPSESSLSVPTGVGFGNYSDYQKRQAELERQRQAALAPGPTISNESQAPEPARVFASPPAPQPAPVTPEPVPQAAPEKPSASAVASVAPQAGASQKNGPLPETAPAPVNAEAVANVPEASPIWDKPIDRTVPEPPAGSDVVTDENSFSRVTAQRTRHQDAARLERNRERYVIIEPTELPKRPGTNKPNIVAYAVATTNPVGEPLYKRGVLDTAAASARACAKYVSPDLAQEAFLSSGGPKRDPKRLDPDGDGFACTWDPTVFRSVKN